MYLVLGQMFALLRGKCTVTLSINFAWIHIGCPLIKVLFEVHYLSDGLQIYMHRLNTLMEGVTQTALV